MGMGTHGCMVNISDAYPTRQNRLSINSSIIVGVHQSLFLSHGKKLRICHMPSQPPTTPRYTPPLPDLGWGAIRPSLTPHLARARIWSWIKRLEGQIPLCDLGVGILRAVGCSSAAGRDPNRGWQGGPGGNNEGCQLPTGWPGTAFPQCCNWPPMLRPGVALDDDIIQVASSISSVWMQYPVHKVLESGRVSEQA